MTPEINRLTVSALADPQENRTWLAIRRAALETWPDDLEETQVRELAAITAALAALPPVSR